MAYLTYGLETSSLYQLKRTVYLYIFKIMKFVFELFINISSYPTLKYNHNARSINSRVP
jgi:hypothetical protein